MTHLSKHAHPDFRHLSDEAGQHRLAGNISYRIIIQGSALTDLIVPVNDVIETSLQPTLMASTTRS